VQGRFAQLIVSSLHGASSADITSRVCEVHVVRTRSVVGEWRCCYNPEDGGSIPTTRWCLSVKQRGVTLSLVCSDRQRVNPVSLFSYCHCHIKWPNDVVFRRFGARLSPRIFGLDPTLVSVGFIVGKVTLGQVFLPVLQLPPVSIIPPMFLTH